MKECLRCGVKKDHPKYGFIWLSEDGYCSICNVEFKDRKRRILGMDKYVEATIIEEGKYIHLDSQGRKLTKNRELLNSLYKKNRAINAGVIFFNIKNKRIKTLEEWIK